MSLPDRIASWNEEDHLIAEGFRVNRLRRQFAALNESVLLLTKGNALEIRTHQPHEVDAIVENITQLAYQSWITLGAVELTVWFESELIFHCLTQDLPPCRMQRFIEEALQSEEDFSHEDSEMVATLTAQSKTKTALPSKRERPKRRRIATVAQVLQLSDFDLIALCDQIGVLIEEDEQGVLTLALQDVGTLMTQWGIAKLESISSPATAELPPPESSNGKTADETPAKTPAKTAAKKSRTIDMGDFKPTLNDYVKTATAALEQFANGEKRRLQIATAIARGTQDGRKYLKALIEKYPEARRSNAQLELRKAFGKISDAPSTSPLETVEV